MSHHWAAKGLLHRYQFRMPCHFSISSGGKITFFDYYEILVQIVDYKWHGSDKACKLYIYGLILVLPL